MNPAVINQVPYAPNEELTFRYPEVTADPDQVLQENANESLDGGWIAEAYAADHRPAAEHETLPMADNQAPRVENNINPTLDKENLTPPSLTPERAAALVGEIAAAGSVITSARRERLQVF